MTCRRLLDVWIRFKFEGIVLEYRWKVWANYIVKHGMVSRLCELMKPYGLIGKWNFFQSFGHHVCNDSRLMVNFGHYEKGHMSMYKYVIL